MKRSLYSGVKILVGALACVCLTFLVSVEAQAPATVEKFTQLQAPRYVQPNEHYYAKIGTIGTSELDPCAAAVRVWSSQGGPLKVYTSCRIQADGYAAVVIENGGDQPVLIYDKIVVAVMK